MHSSKVVPRQWTREVSQPHIYMSLSLSFPGLPTANISQQLFTDVLTRALTELYGLIGGAVPFTLLEFGRGRGILQLDKGDAEKVWSAAAYATTYDGHDIQLQVLRASPFLMLLAVDSRDWAVGRVGTIVPLAGCRPPRG